MKSIFKKNQLMITALAVMIAIAGYLQFAGENIDPEYVTVEDGFTDISDEDMAVANLTDVESLDSEVDVIMEDYLEEGMVEVAEVTGDAGAQVVEGTTGAAMQVADAGSQVAEVTPEDGEIPGEAVFTSTSGVTVLSEAKLLKEQTRAKNKETLMEIINSAGITDEQKQDAINSMVEMTEIAEKETAAEILLEAKGFSDVVVSINEDAVDVVVNAAELSDAQRAQIEDIVKRKTDISAENVIISTVSQ